MSRIDTMEKFVWRGKELLLSHIWYADVKGKEEQVALAFFPPEYSFAKVIQMDGAILSDGIYFAIADEMHNLKQKLEKAERDKVQMMNFLLRLREAKVEGWSDEAVQVLLQVMDLDESALATLPERLQIVFLD